MEGADFLKLEELILLAIAGKSEIYGLEIANDITQASANRVQLNYGSLYPYLNRLEKKGYITSRWEEENARKGARRKYYQITDKGTQSLDEATLIRQKLRLQNDVPTAIASHSQSERNIEKLLLLLQHPEEQERILAIYRLEYEAKLDRFLYWEIMQALAAFIRINSPLNKEGNILSDIQTALNVVGNREIGEDPPDEFLDLSLTNLKEANLKGANLKGANLRGANLKGANLGRANLEEVNLERANLERANLGLANLGLAYLREANLERANLGSAHLREANLERANLELAHLRGANLEQANLEGSQNLTIVQLHFALNWDRAIGIPDS
jgi:DNA-binding PadR family transcriptional regulator